MKVREEFPNEKYQKCFRRGFNQIQRNTTCCEFLETWHWNGHFGLLFPNRVLRSASTSIRFKVRNINFPSTFSVHRDSQFDFFPFRFPSGILPANFLSIQKVPLLEICDFVLLPFVVWLTLWNFDKLFRVPFNLSLPFRHFYEVIGYSIIYSSQNFSCTLSFFITSGFWSPYGDGSVPISKKSDLIWITSEGKLIYLACKQK